MNKKFHFFFGISRAFVRCARGTAAYAIRSRAQLRHWRTSRQWHPRVQRSGSVPVPDGRKATEAEAYQAPANGTFTPNEQEISLFFWDFARVRSLSFGGYRGTSGGYRTRPREVRGISQLAVR